MLGSFNSPTDRVSKMRFALIAMFLLFAVGCGADTSVKPPETVAPPSEELSKGAKGAAPSPPGGVL